MDASSAMSAMGSSGGGGGMAQKLQMITGSVIGTAGAVQFLANAFKKRKLWKNQPILGTTAGETENTALYKQAAAATELPGQRQYEDKLGQTYAEGVYDSQRGAISSLGVQKSAVDLASKKMQAIQDLAGQFAEYKQQRMDALAGWNRERINLDQQRFKVNSYDPWNVKMNEATSGMQSGFNTFIQGGQVIAGAAIDNASSNKYSDILQNLGKGDSGAGKESYGIQEYNPNATYSN